MRQRLSFADPLTVSEQLREEGPQSRTGWQFWFGPTPGVAALGAFLLNPMGAPAATYQKLRGNLGMLPSSTSGRTFISTATKVLKTLIANSNVRQDAPLDLVLWADDLPEDEVNALRQSFPKMRLLKFSITDEGPLEEVLEA